MRLAFEVVQGPGEINPRPDKCRPVAVQDKILTVITAHNGVKCLTSTENRRRTLRYCAYRFRDRLSKMLTKAIQHKSGSIKSYKIVQSISDGMNVKCTTVKSAGLH